MKKFKSFLYQDKTIAIWIVLCLAIVLLIAVLASVIYMFYCLATGQIDRALTIALCLSITAFLIKLFTTPPNSGRRIR